MIFSPTLRRKDHLPPGNLPAIGFSCVAPVGWEHVNLTGDYVWSEAATYDTDGLRPLNSEPEPIAA